MWKKIIITLPILIKTFVSDAQNLPLLNIKTQNKIFEISVNDSFLLNKIDSFISIRSKIDTTFQKKGYITIDINNRNTEADSNIINNYSYFLYINHSYTSIWLDDKNSFYPNYYFFYKNKLITVRLVPLNRFISQNYSMRSKKKFLKILQKYVYKENSYIKDANNKKIKLKSRGKTGFGSGFYICYSTKGYAPISFRPKYY